jgi:cytochrome c oxidase subunit 1
MDRRAARAADAMASPRAVSVLFLVAAVPLLAVPAIYLLVPAGSLPHMELFAKLMLWGHPYMAPLILLGALSLWGLRDVPADPAKSALRRVLHPVCARRRARLHDPRRQRGDSGALPWFDGRRDAGLHGARLRAPATPGLPAGSRAGWRSGSPTCMASANCVHVLGLAWSGGYGVQRKVAGAEQLLTTLPQKIGMGMMGLGGLIAIIGGLMFVVVCPQGDVAAQRDEAARAWGWR